MTDLISNALNSAARIYGRATLSENDCCVFARAAGYTAAQEQAFCESLFVHMEQKPYFPAPCELAQAAAVGG